MPVEVDARPLCSAVVGCDILRLGAGGAVTSETDCVARETPVALAYNGVAHAVMMASPGDLEDFALGFSLSEQIIASPAELRGCRVVALDVGVRLDLTIPEARAADAATRGRGMAGRTGCGLCGVREIDQAVRPLRRVAAGSTFDVEALHRALADLRRHQALNRQTGAVHAAAWASPDGAIRCVREDVGRHNALDKLVGALMRSSDGPPEGFLLMTSRASYEIVQKAALLGATMVVAISGPTSLAIELAEEAGLTLVAFARESSCVVYSAPGRLSGLAWVAA